MPNGRGTRCFGFSSLDGPFAHCTRPEYAGRLPETGAGTFGHCLDGPCGCGQRHGLGSVSQPRTNLLLSPARTEAARRIWGRARPAVGTIVEDYLKSRGLTAPIPPTLRFAILRHGPSGRDMPAMVAAVQLWPGIHPVAVHRTFLKTDVSDKAEVADPKLSYGPIRGAANRLAPSGETLLIGEGIKSALSGQQETEISARRALSRIGIT